MLPNDMRAVREKMKKTIFGLLFFSLIIGMGFAILYPLIKLAPVVFNNLEDLGNPDVIWVPEQFSTVSFQAAMRLAFGNGMPILQSVGFAAVIAFIQIFVSAIAGYSLGRVDFWGKHLVLFLVILTFVVPPQSLLISQYLSFKHFDMMGIMTAMNGGTIDLLNKPYTLYLIALFGFGVKQSMFVFIFRQFFKGLPKELEEAAYIDGCSFYKTYFRVGLPNAVPAIMTVAILAFVWNYGDTYYTGYFHPDGPYLSLKLATTFAPANVNHILYAIRTWYDVPGATTFAFDAAKQAAAFIYLLPLLMIYFVVQKRIVENFEQSGIVG
ncbi:ABC transporter permease subunit [Cohnella sp. CFH 77786]|uniref:carbohydrate ABC transporter permease n=1 Tax=Cohnella sp. CFH 77786 TaxID=2662265 RepID=UPI001C60AE3C|nr:carbohydrate ABC transporter permease [Cohnella sp. CFH 77786]MBW5445789.1 ABC transporter permease subunit [Cohnella sp. CFH 77786]